MTKYILLATKFISETLIDRLVDRLFDKDLLVDSEKKYFLIKRILAENNIYLEVFYDKNSNIIGRLFDLEKVPQLKIDFRIPMRFTHAILVFGSHAEKNKFFSDKRVIRTIFHELTHFINYDRIPSMIKGKDNLSIKATDLDMRNINIRNVKEFLDYALHIREISSFAFSTSYSFINDFSKEYSNVEELIDKNKGIIKAFIDSKIEPVEFNNYTSHLFRKSTDLIHLFQVQFSYLLLSKELRKEYSSRFSNYIKLCIKYEKRLNKIFDTSK